MRKLLLFLLVLLAACSGAEASAPKAETISCTAAYRASVEQGVEREETILFGDTDSEQSIPFTDMVFHAAYSAGESDNERNLRVWVTDVGDTAVFHTTLYQLPINSGPQNQFVGGHGFTGLNYSYQPDSGAELQFWCEAK
jgi:hypothetical protein